MPQQLGSSERGTANVRIGGRLRTSVSAARELRRTMTPAERLLWRELREHRLAGIHFRRQHPVGPFVLDFACPARFLAVEVDGAIHERQVEQDAARGEILEAYGWTVLRVTNANVLTNLPATHDRIAANAAARPLALRRPNARGG